LNPETEKAPARGLFFGQNLAKRSNKCKQLSDDGLRINFGVNRLNFPGPFAQQGGQAGIPQ
jgi:hypothetical protein